MSVSKKKISRLLPLLFLPRWEEGRWVVGGVQGGGEKAKNGWMEEEGSKEEGRGWLTFTEE